MNNIESKYNDNLLRTNHFEIELTELSLIDDSEIKYNDIKYCTKCVKYISSDKFILTAYTTPQIFNLLNRISKRNPDFNVKIISNFESLNVSAATAVIAYEAMRQIYLKSEQIPK